GGAELCDQEMSIWSNSTKGAPYSRTFLDWQLSESDFAAQYDDKDYSSYYTDWEKSNKYRENGVKTLLEVCKAYRTKKHDVITRKFKALTQVTAKGHWSKSTTKPTFA
ncbi:hypothetical protein LRR18_17450, partial [Mangrovimonas sp. AS39]|uniref:hypothetical protein n=1 Tax=Mangrovimonas futianensis TaxID=2895523 RepID=UPI001E5DD5E5